MNDIRDAYNLAANSYRAKYDSIPPRVEDVDVALSFSTKDNPKVVEIGCAYGREATYILSKTNQYIGIDVCDEFIKMAQEEIPQGTFVQADVATYQFPQSVDVVLAFASLLHTSKEDMELVLQRIVKSLNSGGVVFLSLKRRDVYCDSVETDEYVSRQFYYYTRDTILDIAPSEFKEVYYEEQILKEPWFTMALQKL
ncbi:MAG: class I SAM-dependent methyltransferase [Candidatus Paceibacteria bacterium]